MSNTRNRSSAVARERARDFCRPLDLVIMEKPLRDADGIVDLVYARCTDGSLALFAQPGFTEGQIDTDGALAHAGLTRSTLNDHMDALVRFGARVVTRKERCGRVRFFALEFGEFYRLLALDSLSDGVVDLLFRPSKQARREASKSHRPGRKPGVTVYQKYETLTGRTVPNLVLSKKPYDPLGIIKLIPRREAERLSSGPVMTTWSSKTEVKTSRCMSDLLDKEQEHMDAYERPRG